MTKPISTYDVTYTMDSTRRNALNSCLPDLRVDLIVEHFYPSLHLEAGGFLNDVELESVKCKSDRFSQVDELVRILLGKGNDEFERFCLILEERNYYEWASKLRKKSILRRRRGGNPSVPERVVDRATPMEVGEPSTTDHSDREVKATQFLNGGQNR